MTLSDYGERLDTKLDSIIQTVERCAFILEKENNNKRVENKGWSEKDKKNVETLRKVIQDSYLSRQRGNELINWLFSLELTVQPH